MSRGYKSNKWLIMKSVVFHDKLGLLVFVLIQVFPCEEYAVQLLLLLCTAIVSLLLNITSSLAWCLIWILIIISTGGSAEFAYFRAASVFHTIKTWWQGGGGDDVLFLLFLGCLLLAALFLLSLFNTAPHGFRWYCFVYINVSTF